jgi:hypothetical protein
MPAKEKEYNDYGTEHHDPQVDVPLSLSDQTNTTTKRNRAWRSVGGVLSSQNFGSVQSFEDKQQAQLPESDKGVSSK